MGDAPQTRDTVFVTHAAPEDNDFALWLSSKLAIAGYRVWVDKQRLRGGDDFWSEIDEWIWYQEEPTIASAPYAYYSVYRLASEHVKVMVSGNGGTWITERVFPPGITSARSSCLLRDSGLRSM